MAQPSANALYERVTNQMIAELEQGHVPWVRPWGTPAAGAAIALPVNASTGKTYSGINILILWSEVIERGYGSQLWLTYRQSIKLGGHVRRGERGVTCCHADKYIPKDERERAKRDGDDPRPIFYLKQFSLFNVHQCDGLPPEVCRIPAPLPKREIMPEAERLIAATGADIRIGGDRAYYDVIGDFIALPPQPCFPEQIAYYLTALHELTHWTGHATRLDRDQTGIKGSEPYAREELVAEMGAAFLSASLNIAPAVRHRDYIGFWLDLLKEDNRAVFRAASKASKAADFILACGSDADADLKDAA